MRLRPQPARRRPADHPGAPGRRGALPAATAGRRLQPLRPGQPGVRQPGDPPALRGPQPSGPGAPAGTDQRRPAGAQGNPGGRPLRRRRLCQPAPLGHGGGRHAHPHQPGGPPRHPGPARAPLPLRLRRLRREPRPLVLPRPPELAGARVRLRHRPRARWRRAGRGLVSRRQAGAQEQYLRRLHRLRRTPGRRGLYHAVPARDQRRQCRRPADGGSAQPAPGAVRRGHCRSALRRRAEHHAEPRPAADRHRI
ncbi:hypothetical protein D9M68_606750 [compost metagenome]